MGCSTVHQHGETCGNGQGSEVSESAGKSDISTGAPVATEHQGCSGNSEVPEDSEGSELESRIWPHHFRKSPNNVDQHGESLLDYKEDLCSETDG